MTHARAASIVALDATDLRPAPPVGGVVAVPGQKVEATDDASALRLYLARFDARRPNTLRGVKREVLRFLGWLHDRHGASDRLLPGVGVEDVNDYLKFVRTPAPSLSQEAMDRYQIGAGARGQRRPFRGALTSPSVIQLHSILGSLYAGLMQIQSPWGSYVPRNPFRIVGKPRAHSVRLKDKACSPQEWALILEVVQNLPRHTDSQRRRANQVQWMLSLIYLAALRREEAATLTMGAFERSRGGWVLRITGKGRAAMEADNALRPRDRQEGDRIIVPEALLQALQDYRTGMGLSPLPEPGENNPAIFNITGKAGVSSQLVYLTIKTVGNMAADLAQRRSMPWEAVRLRQISPHWLRHSCITHLLDAGVPARVAQKQARHSSLSVTAHYDHGDEDVARKSLNNHQRNAFTERSSS